MLRAIHKIVTGLMIALGLIHILFTFHDYDEFSMRALWFASAGVAIILAGFLNLVLLRDVGKDKLVWFLGILTNFIFVVMFGAVLFLMPQPQVFVGVALFGTGAVLALLNPQKVGH
jgi:hypothetical protein